MKKLTLIVMACSLALGLAGCGVKPGTVEPPEEVKNKEFPRTYPNIDTEPAPYVPPVINK